MSKQVMTAAQTSPQAEPRQASATKYVVASLIGNSLEWYDFFLYATASAVVFNVLMFPAGTDPLVGALGAYAGLAVGFVARPLGGVIFGHIGDKVSRKTSLIITLVVMGLASTAMGLLPTYASIGIAAPIILVLLRVAQGIAAGGEWGGAVLLISENSSQKRRGMLAAFSQSGVSLGFVTSALAFYAVKQLPEEQFLTWGWRLPFLFSIVLLIVGLYIRRSLPEETADEAETVAVDNERIPMVEAFRRFPGQMFAAMGMRIAENGGSYIFMTFSVVYGKHVGVDDSLLLLMLAITMTLSFFSFVFFGHLSDVVGRRRVYAFGAVGMIVVAAPFFSLIETGSVPLMLLGFVLALCVCHGAMIGTQPSLFHELFPAEVRYSAISIAHEVASVFAGGIAPMIATALLLKYDSPLPIVIYLIVMCLITLVSVLVSRKYSFEVKG
ncbi:MFS transporter [Pseudoglutamicibacter cumminsii]|nr:MFS transporter [Pseudoglutamicibacter cumminsii]